jgi:hypothetical protein
LLEKREGDPKASEELWQAASRQARDQLAGMLQQFINSSASRFDSSNVQAAVTRVEKIQLPLERVTDIGSWFPTAVRRELWSKGGPAIPV